jgi:hypothetical protein
MESKRNNLKQRIAEANNPAYTKKQMETSNLMGMSLLEVNEDTSDDGYDENSLISHQQELRRRKNSFSNRDHNSHKGATIVNGSSKNSA